MTSIKFLGYNLVIDLKSSLFSLSTSRMKAAARHWHELGQLSCRVHDRGMGKRAGLHCRLLGSAVGDKNALWFPLMSPSSQRKVWSDGLLPQQVGTKKINTSRWISHWLTCCLKSRQHSFLWDPTECWDGKMRYKSSHWLFVLELQRIPFILITSSFWKKAGERATSASSACTCTAWAHWPRRSQENPLDGASTASAQDTAAWEHPVLPGCTGISTTCCISTTRKLENRRGIQTRCSQKRLPW